MLKNIEIYFPVQDKSDIVVDIAGQPFTNTQVQDLGTLTDNFQVDKMWDGGYCVVAMQGFGETITATFSNVNTGTYVVSALLSPRPHPTRPHITA
jgi:hypothetical protein